MKAFFNRIPAFFYIITSKIAFYPTLIAFMGFFFALTMGFVEKGGVSQNLVKSLPYLVIENGDTALTLISACIGGLISLMVFSFSMVMLLLSQASNNYSPRLLPGLISNKDHQIVLGIYLGTIIYNIFTLFSIEPSEEKYTLPGLSILIGIVLTIVCLIAFIYFIHNISQSIQINNIMEKIYDDARKRLENLIEEEVKNSSALARNFPGTENWITYTAGKSGYFQNISYKNIASLIEEFDSKIYITVPQGFYIFKNTPLIKSEKELEQKTVDQIISNISFARGELVRDNHTLAFKQITEIAVKSMSPGINDPGTAINAIDYLTEIFALRMKKLDNGVKIVHGKANLKIAVITFEEIMYNVMASLRTYCAHDPIIVQKMLWMLQYLEKQPAKDDSYINVITKEIKSLKAQAGDAMENKRDVEIIEN